MFKPHNIIMVKRSVNFNLRHEFLLCPGLSKRRFGYYFSSSNSLSFQICELIALSKPSFTQELASQVFLDAHISIELDQFLFYYDLGVILHEVVLASLALRFSTHL